jgi:hypothetical protein
LARSNVQVIKELKMRKRNIALSLAAAPAIAVLISSCSQNVAGSNLTLRCTETLTGADVTDGGVSGSGHCALTGRLHDNGPATDYRTQTGDTVFIRRVVVGAKGTITFVIKIPTVGAGGEPWTITSGTKTYAKLHGRGYQVVDNYTGTPATFVMKGTVSQGQA